MQRPQLIYLLTPDPRKQPASEPISAFGNMLTFNNTLITYN